MSNAKSCINLFSKSPDASGIDFSCRYACSGKKAGVAASGLSATTAFHRSVMAAVNCGVSLVGNAAVCGNWPGSVVEVVVTGVVVVVDGGVGRAVAP